MEIMKRLASANKLLAQGVNKNTLHEIQVLSTIYFLLAAMHSGIACTLKSTYITCYSLNLARVFTGRSLEFWRFVSGIYL